MKNFCYRIHQVERFHELLRLDVREHQQMTLNDTAGEKKNGIFHYRKNSVLYGELVTLQLPIK